MLHCAKAMDSRDSLDALGGKFAKHMIYMPFTMSLRVF
jgi:hypothetical protein